MMVSKEVPIEVAELRSRLTDAEISNDRLRKLVATCLEQNLMAIAHNERAIQAADIWKQRAESAEARLRKTVCKHCEDWCKP